MKQKNLVKKAVFPALVALLCSVIALTSVSYAWFTMGNEASVTGMELNVTTADGLQISASGNGNEYKSNLDLDDLEAVLEGENPKYQFPEEVVPVSTGKSIDATTKHILFYEGQVEDGNLASVEATTADYIWFDIYVQVTTGDKLYLDKGSKVVDLVDGKQTSLSSRVAFCLLGTGSTPAEAQEQVLESTDTVVIWEPNALKRTTAAINEGRADNVAIPVKGVNGAGPSYTNEDISTLKPTYNANWETTAQQELFTLGVGYNKIRVYIWLEGQDVDCLNEVSGGTIAVTLKFANKQKQ